MLRFKSALLLALLMTINLLARADSLAPQDWLQKMSSSHRQLNYQGLFTYEQADSIQTLRIFHALIDGEEYERLERLNSTELNVVRKGHGPSCLHAGDKLIKLLKQQHNSHVGMAHFYDFSIAGRDRVAGRKVVILAVMPRDKHRFGHRLSLDEETGLLLRGVQYSADNKVLERFQFVDIELNADIPRETFNEPKHMQQAAHIAPAVNDKANYAWRLSWLPGGFKSIPSPAKKSPVDSQTFTDGLAVFSVFVEPHQDNSPAAGVQGRAQRGATMAYSRAFQLHGQTYRVTVVGEIPQLTAERVAASIVAAS
ncbi:MucB/RseB C-terminal domain-containing protein [Dasania sp. GY-MA-18]|uniref:MucB/RseB C-terminal domain-containing protein n=1 Tax=Dasania phycosphaerae TaxID=2950436 RepID=A0A9J6RN11_9GAMM|nr:MULTISPECIES: MucB/RseB C-terminal domain-containing protein [Dasania]MCR8923306.1 MucB/RseB C-terminal domain-containing protein [Dasania sp. GY-MA-18]MCZ0865738.1 MucB/RseB C-terminal domain-containing protein [Dasania phycosphaerae]MCZ0869463.1 MucB/RseB C-terminal domain-containing protein [Dasania phycosphaerae]